MRHEHRLEVQSYECDANGHVNNAVYLNYLESARVAFLRAAGASYRDLREKGYSLVVVRVCIDFRGKRTWRIPSSWSRSRSRSGSPAGSSARGCFEKSPVGPHLVAEAEVTWVCVDSRKKPTRIPAFLDVPSLLPAGESA